jgi:RHS repeat-associated protein
MQIVSRTGSNDSYAWTGHGSGTSAIGVDGLNRPTAIGLATETYDSKGNVSSHNHWGVRTFSWTSENLLAGTTVASPASSWTFGYDPLGRLAGSAAYGGSQLLYDGDTLIGDQYTSYGSSRYVHGPGTDEPLVSVNASTGARSWYAADERGSIVALTDASGAATAIQAYDENGVAASQTGRFGFTGQMALPELGAGTYYYKARIYDARRGGFLQPDPIGYKGGMNLYGYVGGDPVNFSDPSGLAEKKNKRSSQSDGLDSPGGDVVYYPPGLTVTGHRGHGSIALALKAGPVRYVRKGLEALVDIGRETACAAVSKIPGNRLRVGADAAGGLLGVIAAGVGVSISDNGDVMFDKYAQIGRGGAAILGIGATADNGAARAGTVNNRPVIAQVGFGPVGGGFTYDRDSGDRTISGGVFVGAKVGGEAAAMDESGTETTLVIQLKC